MVFSGIFFTQNYWYAMVFKFKNVGSIGTKMIVVKITNFLKYLPVTGIHWFNMNDEMLI